MHLNCVATERVAGIYKTKVPIWNLPDSSLFFIASTSALTTKTEMCLFIPNIKILISLYLPEVLNGPRLKTSLNLEFA